MMLYSDKKEDSAATNKLFNYEEKMLINRGNEGMKGKGMEGNEGEMKGNQTKC